MPWRALLQRWWPRLLPGLAASATHGVIRTAHAVRVAARWPATVPTRCSSTSWPRAWASGRPGTRPLPGRPALAGPLDAVHATAGCPGWIRPSPRTVPGSSGRLRAVVRVDGWIPGRSTRGVRRRRCPTSALDELIGAAARVLAARPDAPIAFCHAVTAPAAVRLVLPELSADVARASVAASWQVVGGIVAAFASPRIRPRPLRWTPIADPLLERLDPRRSSTATSM